MHPTSVPHRPGKSTNADGIDNAVRALAGGKRRLVLAVSGGIDSMVLLDACAAILPDRVAVVATFDHGSGAAATAAAGFVADEAVSRRLPVVVGRGDGGRRTEAAWREQRWGFLRDVASRVDGDVVTGHSLDDHLETVLMRALRGASARGLAALYAPSPGIIRPLVDIRRRDIERYAASRSIAWRSDPTNDDRRFLRNRVRHDLLPALRRVRPRIDEELRDLSWRAAELRRDVDAIAGELSSLTGDGRTVSVDAALLTSFGQPALGVLWPAIAARVGLALDWRGTNRLVSFTIRSARSGGSAPLAGGWAVVRERRELVLRRRPSTAPAPAELPRDGVLRWGRWVFARDRGLRPEGAWRASLPSGADLRVRSWRPGDRMVGAAGMRRRVKRFLGDAGISGPHRVGWPVVLAGEEIVWIPGVSRSHDAGSSDAPGLIYTCEHNDR